MKWQMRDWVSLGLVVAAFGVALALYSRLPDPVPVHWGPHGSNGFAPKPWGAFELPLLTAGLWLLFWALPALSPRGFELRRFDRAFSTVRIAAVCLMFTITVVALLRASDPSRERLFRTAIPFTVGAFCVALGNVFGKLQRNFYVGIRTPWTLANREVWCRTHRLGGRLYVAAGLLAMVLAFLTPHVGLSIAPIIAATLAAVVYSFVLSRRIDLLPPAPHHEPGE